MTFLPKHFELDLNDVIDYNDIIEVNVVEVSNGCTNSKKFTRSNKRGAES